MKVVYISRRRATQFVWVTALVLLSIVYAYGFKYDAISVFLNVKREIPIYSVEKENKEIAISFDAAWGSEFTDEILHVLKERNIKTTFFLVGFWVDRYPDKVRNIAAEGHEIGNHSTNHPHMSNLSKDQIIRELETTQEKIQQLAGSRAVKLFRPPFGDYNNLLVTTCRELGYYPIQWDIDSLDWKNYGVSHMYKQVTEKVRNGSIVLFHNNAEYTAEALPLILDQLIEEGYKIVPISELIYKDGYYIDHTGRQKLNN